MWVDHCSTCWSRRISYIAHETYRIPGRVIRTHLRTTVQQKIFSVRYQHTLISTAFLTCLANKKTSKNNPLQPRTYKHDEKSKAEINSAYNFNSLKAQFFSPFLSFSHNELLKLIPHHAKKANENNMGYEMIPVCFCTIIYGSAAREWARNQKPNVPLWNEPFWISYIFFSVFLLLLENILLKWKKKNTRKYTHGDMHAT